MDIKEILKACDHTVLSTTATEADIFAAIDDGIAYSTASVCIPPHFVKVASEYARGRIKICTVIGFPNGYSTTEVKVYEAECAVRDGAHEVDMVINLCMLRDGRYDDLLAEINAIKRAIGDKTLKVIIEVCQLTESEKIKMCELVSASEADFIKTSTGFSIGGATHRDIELLCRHTVGKSVKAAGGIASLADAEDYLALGAKRLGTSKIIAIVKNLTPKSNY